MTVQAGPGVGNGYTGGKAKPCLLLARGGGDAAAVALRAACSGIANTRIKAKKNGPSCVTAFHFGRCDGGVSGSGLNFNSQVDSSQILMAQPWRAEKGDGNGKTDQAKRGQTYGALTRSGRAARPWYRRRTSLEYRKVTTARPPRGRNVQYFP